MAQMETNGSSDGNTKKTRPTPSKYWCFTLNNYTEEEMVQLETTFKESKSEYVIGKEVGEKGTPHLQGFVSFEKKQRPMELRGISKRIHWEKTKAGKQANIDYCSKEGNVTTNMLTKETKRRMLEIPEQEDLYEWQRDALYHLDEQNHRAILWCWDSLGCSGKTTLAKLLILEQDALLIDGKKSDILYAATEFLGKDLESAFYKKLIFILDLSRTCENFVSYDAIEKLKNGLWFSGKYESKMVMIPSPKLIVFANFPPDKTKLSQDRWVILESKKTEIEKT